MKKLSVLVAGLMGMSAFAAPVQPNLFECRGQGVEVGFTTTSFQGKPTFSLKQNGQSTHRTGDELRQVKTVAGTLVSVNLRYVPDLKTDSATLVVPHINIRDHEEVKFGTMLILTSSRTSIGGPGLVQGVINPSSYVPVSCTAKHVQF
jgi:hypothetical protein